MTTKKPETLWVEAEIIHGEDDGEDYGLRILRYDFMTDKKELDKLRAAQPKGIFRDGIEICSSCMKPFDEPSIPYPYKCCWVCLEHYKKNARAAQPKSKILAYEEGKEFGMDLAYNDYDYKLKEARAAGIAQGKKDVLDEIEAEWNKDIKERSIGVNPYRATIAAKRAELKQGVVPEAARRGSTPRTPQKEKEAPKK